MVNPSRPSEPDPVPDPPRRSMRRFEPTDGAGVLVTAAAGGLWAAVLASAADAHAVRTLVFAGTPIVLLAGLHARLVGYVHSPARMRLLPLPLRPVAHWAAARSRHRVAFAATAAIVCGAAGLGLGLRADLPGLGSMFALLHVLWIVAMAALIEPVIGAVAAFGGRRFPPGSPGHRLQHSLGGGWTTPEATVHLYGPALGTALAAALAMPGLLGLQWVEEGRPLSPLPFAVPLACAAILRAVASRLYARGVWEAVPYLAETTRTLAGPPEPEPIPRWVAAIGDPSRRLVLIQFLRLSPLPLVRLVVFIGWGTVVLTRSTPPGAPAVVVGSALAGLWLMPARAVFGERRARARLLASLPTRERRDPVPLLLCLTPLGAVVVLLAVRFGAFG